MKLEKAVAILRKELRKDKDYYYGWQANIAVSFQDEYSKIKGKGKPNTETIHEASNKAARNFLNLLIRESK